MLSLFNHVARSESQYPEDMKAQIFIQGLHSDLLMAIESFMLNKLQEAIDRSRVCKATLIQELAVCKPTSIYNMLSRPSSYLLQEVVLAVRDNKDSDNQFCLSQNQNWQER
ncbi:12828_t:CDS:2, partial [Cetraspora pellucida]